MFNIEIMAAKLSLLLKIMYYLVGDVKKSGGCSGLFVPTHLHNYLGNDMARVFKACNK